MVRVREGELETERREIALMMQEIRELQGAVALGTSKEAELNETINAMRKGLLNSQKQIAAYEKTVKGLRRSLRDCTEASSSLEAQYSAVLLKAGQSDSQRKELEAQVVALSCSLEASEAQRKSLFLKESQRLSALHEFRDSVAQAKSAYHHSDSNK